MLRAGNVHSARRWRDVLEPILSRYGATGVRRYFRADAAFAKPDIYEYLEERRVFYAIRLPSNKVLQYEIAPLLIRPVGRPPKRPVILYDDFWYRAGSWDRARRVAAKVEWHRGELFPRVGASQRGSDQRQHLVPSVRPSRRAAEVKVMVDEFPQAQVPGERGRQEQAGIGHQAMVVKEDADTVGVVTWQHLLGAPCFRAGFCSKTIIPDSEEHPLASSRAVPKTVLRWIRA